MMGLVGLVCNVSTWVLGTHFGSLVGEVPVSAASVSSAEGFLTGVSQRKSALTFDSSSLS